MQIRFIDRETGTEKTEAVYGEGALRWVYETLPGKAALAVLVRRAFFSKIYGALMSSPRSRAKIAPFIEKFGLDASEFAEPPSSFASFNDFFSRRLKASARPLAETAAVLPADGRHLAFPRADAGATTIYAKGQAFDLEKLLGDAEAARRFSGGALLCSRLCPTDYHRFHFPVAGTPGAPRLVNGSLYSVNPIALSRRLAYLWENKRVVVEIDSPVFGRVAQVLIGATNVGTTTPVAAASAASAIVVLSPTPPVETLEIFGSAMSSKSTVSPENIISSAKAAVSAADMFLK